MMTDAQSKTLTPEWLAHRYDPTTDTIQFVDVDRATRAHVPFLTDENLGVLPPTIVRRSDVSVPPEARSDVRYIFHSAYCCSTLLANAYDRPGLSFSLKEPVIFNDIVGWRHRSGTPAQLGAVLGDAVRLLARPFVPGERCIIKPSNVVNGFAPALLGGRDDVKALLLHAPLRVYLGSIASKGLWGRLWVRDLLSKQLQEGFVDLDFTAQDYFRQSDLQVAAVGWLAQHALFAKLAAAMPTRVRTLNSEALLANPEQSLAALDDFFGVADNAAGRGGIISSIFSRNAKSGEKFDASNRIAVQITASELHGDEIDKVLAWAETVADGAGISMTLSSPLLTG